jgi:hypothetical protein
MSKYSPFSEHLQELAEDEVRLSFADIERIIGTTLPRSAQVHHAWWANSRTDDSHIWSHLWLRAGWERGEYSLPERWVTFRRMEHYEVGDLKAREGYEHDAKVLLRTRNVVLAEARKALDNYTCQACGFHLRVCKSYVVEAHHLEPLSASGERETKIEMLVSLCPTCHRIAHLRSRPYAVEEIKDLLGVPRDA